MIFKFLLLIRQKLLVSLFYFNGEQCGYQKNIKPDLKSGESLKTMSDFVLKPPSSRSVALRFLVDWLKQAKVAARLPNRPAASPTPFLRDVGLTQDQIGRAVVRGSFEIGLLSLGWQSPNRIVRR
jgi:hypothetical protein